MTNQEILDNAPEGATHWDGGGYMIAEGGINNYFNPKKSKWIYVSELVLEPDTRSLADIAKITELEEDVEPLALYDFIDSYEGLPIMQFWDWLMYNGYIKRVKEQGND